MSIYRFIASIIDSLAWPVVLLILFLWFRKPLTQLLSELSSLKFNNIELDFGNELYKLERMLEGSDQGNDSQSPYKTMNKKPDEVKTVAATSPNAAVAMTWTMIEQEIISVIKSTDTSSDHVAGNTALKNMELLQDKDLIDESTYHVLEELGVLRNKAIHAHKGKISYLEAMKYYEIASKLMTRLEGINQ